MRQQTIILLQEMNILNKNKPRLANFNYNITTSKNPDSTSVIKITADKVAQCRMVYENMREIGFEKVNSKENIYPKVLSST